MSCGCVGGMSSCGVGALLCCLCCCVEQLLCKLADVLPYRCVLNSVLKYGCAVVLVCGCVGALVLIGCRVVDVLCCCVVLSV